MEENLYNNKKRLDYIDISKGILIIFVVLIHMELSLLNLYPNSIFTKTLHWIDFHTIVVFYMPAFFIITGFCSNYSKDFSHFLMSNIISLKIPAFFFVGVAGALGVRTIFGFSPFSIHYWFIRLFETGVWFLHAMFLGKFFYWFLFNYSNIKIRLFILTILFSIGTYLIIQFNEPFYYIPHALMLLPFIEVGQFLKRTDISRKIALISILIFFILLIIVTTAKIEIPYIVQKVVCTNPLSAIIILILGSSGSIAFIYLCKLINKNHVFSTIGQYSLVIYCLHGPELCTYLTTSHQNLYFPEYYLLPLSFFVRVGLVITICILIAIALDRPYFRLIIGKKP